MKKILFCTICGAVAAAVFSGCAPMPPLPPMPEYPPLSGSFNTSAPLYLNPPEEEWLDPLIRQAFQRNGYRNLLGALPDRPVDNAKAKIVTPLDFSQQVVKQPKGDYLVTRLIVSVRKPSRAIFAKLYKRIGDPRTFQARSRLFLGERKLDQGVREEEARHVLENLFTIGAFRESLE